jgi:hypothetical protein
MSVASLSGPTWSRSAGLKWPRPRPTGPRTFVSVCQRRSREIPGVRVRSRVEQFESIRRDARDREMSIRALAAKHRVHRRTVRQALDDAVPPVRKPPARTAPVLGPYEATIRGWLVGDLTAPRKPATDSADAASTACPASAPPPTRPSPRLPTTAHFSSTGSDQSWSAVDRTSRCRCHARNLLADTDKRVDSKDHVGSCLTAPPGVARELDPSVWHPVSQPMRRTKDQLAGHPVVQPPIIARGSSAGTSRPADRHRLAGHDTNVGHDDDRGAAPAVRSTRSGTWTAPTAARWRASRLRVVLARQATGSHALGHAMASLAGLPATRRPE